LPFSLMLHHIEVNHIELKNRGKKQSEIPIMMKTAYRWKKVKVSIVSTRKFMQKMYSLQTTNHQYGWCLNNSIFIFPVFGVPIPFYIALSMKNSFYTDFHSTRFIHLPFWGFHLHSFLSKILIFVAATILCMSVSFSVV
jgi:hypothetical protein